MNLKSFPYKWTCLMGLSILVSLFWSATVMDGPSFVSVFLLGLCFLISVVTSLVLVLFERSKVSF